MSILLVEASLHLSLAPSFPLTIHPSHHPSLSPSPLSPFTPFIDLLVACFGKKSLTIHLSHHSNYRSGYTRTHWKTTRAILRPVRWRSFLPTKGTSALSLSPTPSLSPSFFLLSSYVTARYATGKDAKGRNIMQSIQLFSILPRDYCNLVAAALSIQRFGTSQSLPQSQAFPVIDGMTSAGKNELLCERSASRLNFRCLNLDHFSHWCIF
jgi:uncharacterized membrane protein YbaN (DUF454 family)